ncbi:MmgE/PrpD family protein [Conexibacter sp. JD483]|uniref:MmgE/PrpD family protein n=1 Tax=unclassified Conexibacter TaxID=2627773 RepID=UPI002722A0C7|nr:MULTISPECIES: MmgE/PrpD family protein [unclassified Conexibacter]MDO8187823.1 MmgE/PrpD family protein [Conexibacter sp. CPCC 205706]MDO8199968.1 MmgE/PrpD family protein [Conexibacter sp. CPCC 205762]MDR9369495.1 MmgE/PrpD family protein [Conexibacter sp. JD483]
MTAGAALGRLVAALGRPGAELPEPLLERLRCGLLHDLTVALAAHPVGGAIWPLVRDRGPAEATLLVDGGRVAAEAAAFANAQLMHARAQDDTHFAAKTHVGAAVIPAALALAEREGADGGRLAAAVIAGCEVAAAVGERHAAAATARGFRASPVFGTLGAAAACAVVLGLDEERAAHALAIASSCSGGLNQTWVDGSSEYRLQLGFAARDGLLAARLAAAGERGARHWYEGEAGFARAFGGGAPGGGPSGGEPLGGEAFGAGEACCDDDWQLGVRWRLLDVTYKPHPVCAILQSAVTVAAGLAREHDLDASAVTAVRVALDPRDRAYPGTLDPGPWDHVAATLMSAQFCTALALRDRGASLAGLHDFDDPLLARLAAATTVLADERIPPLGARVEVDTAAGATVAAELLPDARTYGWDWEGVRGNALRMLPELPVDAARLERLAAVVRELTALPTLAPLLRECVA